MKLHLALLIAIRNVSAQTNISNAVEENVNENFFDDEEEFFGDDGDYEDKYSDESYGYQEEYNEEYDEVYEEDNNNYNYEYWEEWGENDWRDYWYELVDAVQEFADWASYEFGLDDEDWNSLFDYYYDGDYSPEDYWYNADSWYNWDYSYLWDDNYDDKMPTWDSEEYDYSDMPDDWFINDDFNIDDLEDWVPWGDYPEADNNPDTGSTDKNTNPGLTQDKIPRNVKCETKYQQSAQSKMLQLARKNPRIVGGETVDLNTWGWYTRLSIKEGGSTYLCGATIIGKRWLLSAAHCTTKDDGTSYSSSDVIAHLNDHSANKMDKFEKTMRIKNVYNHPKYFMQDGRPYNDISLLETVDDLFTTDDYAAPACLPSKDTSTADMQKLKCYVAGFGAVEFQGETSQFLKSIHVNVIKDETCKQAYSSYEEKMEFCAGHLKGGRDACQGDSGGPLVCINEANEPILYGAVSWGGACAMPNQPGLYTRINSYYDWIYTLTRVTRKLELEGRIETSGNNDGSAITSSTSTMINPTTAIICSLFVSGLIQ